MQKTTILIDRQRVDRWVCNRGHPHPTIAGAEDCEAARAEGATDAELLELFNEEVAAFNALI